MSKRDRKHKRIEHRDEIVNLPGQQYYPVEYLQVSEYHDEEEGKGPATEVHMLFYVKGLDAPFVIKFRNPADVDALVSSLVVRRQSVWPEDK